MDFERTKIPLSRRLTKLYPNLKSFDETGSYINNDEVVDAVMWGLGLREAGKYEKLLISPYIVAKVLEDNINYNREKLIKKGYWCLRSEEQELAHQYTWHTENCIYVREVFDENVYRMPDRDYIFGKSALICVGNRAFVLTKVVRKEENEIFEFNNLFPQELKLISSLSFPIKVGRGVVHIKVHGYPFTMPIIDTDAEGFSSKEIEEVKLILSLLKRMHVFKKESSKTEEENVCDSNDDYQARVNKFYDLYDEKDDTLNRSFYLLYKSYILFADQSYLFCEEGYMLLTMAIEGFLKLIAIKEFGKFEQKSIFEFVSKTFPSGEYVAERLKEIYQIRVELVHPINDYNLEWKKDIMADDFIDDIEIAKELAYYFVTGELLEHDNF